MRTRLLTILVSSMIILLVSMFFFYNDQKTQEKNIVMSYFPNEIDIGTKFIKTDFQDYSKLCHDNDKVFCNFITAQKWILKDSISDWQNYIIVLIAYSENGFDDISDKLERFQPNISNDHTPIWNKIESVDDMFCNNISDILENEICKEMIDDDFTLLAGKNTSTHNFECYSGGGHDLLNDDYFYTRNHILCIKDDIIFIVSSHNSNSSYDDTSYGTSLFRNIISEKINSNPIMP